VLAIFLDVIPGAWVVTFPIRQQHRVVRVQRRQVSTSRARHSADAGDKILTFGKHKGKTFEEVCATAPGYIAWFRAQSNLNHLAVELIEYCDQRLETKGSLNPPRSGRVSKSSAAKVRPAASAAPRSAKTSTPRTSGNYQPRQAPETGTLNADIFELPSGVLKDRVVWSCPGNEWNRDDGNPGVWNMKGGWRFVSKVVLGKKLAINLQDSTQKPKDFKQCERLDGSEVSKALSKEQYARFLGAIIEEESRVDMCKPRFINHQGMKLEALPKFRIRGIVTDDKPHLAVVMEQEVYAGAEKHLGGKPKMAAASMVGLKVRPLGPAQPWFSGLVICDPKDDEPQQMTEGEKKKLLAITKTKEVREATKAAAVNELLLQVSKNCTNVKDLRMTFPANALRPSLTGAAQEQRLRQVKGWETWSSLPPARLIVRSNERQQMIADEMLRLNKKLGFPKVSRMSAAHNFHQLQPPKLVTNMGSISGSDPPRVLMSKLRLQPAYHIEEQAPGPVRLHCVVLGKATAEEKAVALRAREDVSRSLKRSGVNMANDEPEVQYLSGGRDDVKQFFQSPEIRSSDAVLLFANSNSWSSDALYDRVKWECLIKGRGNEHHTASQMFDLSKEQVWRSDAKGFAVAVQITSVALLAKLGHVPWALDISGWFRGGRVPDQLSTPVVIGYDVCHLTSPRGAAVHVAAGIQVHSHDSSHLSKIGYRIERVPSETVPADGIKKIVPAELARGRLVIIHRDGEFPHAELKSLRDYHRELSRGKDDGTCFVLVECVKWAGKAPRIYSGTKSAAQGTMLALSANDTLLASSKDLFQGTANPINARLAGILGKLPSGLTDFFWTQSVFDLSYLHHGSVFKRPRLPITTHFADRLAYVLANAGKEWDRELETSKGGYQQFWL
jgi:hypothetical protein